MRSSPTATGVCGRHQPRGRCLHAMNPSLDSAYKPKAGNRAGSRLGVATHCRSKACPPSNFRTQAPRLLRLLTATAAIGSLLGCATPLLLKGNVSRPAAEVLADAAVVREEGLNPQSYTKTVEKMGEYWLVLYSPRPPGGWSHNHEFRVEVSRVTGDARLIPRD
jgi:hypothetical protein